jgi:putative GTP pyrophosphokinase
VSELQTTPAPGPQAAGELAALYGSLRPMYEAFTINMEHLLETLLKSQNIEYLRIEPRTKTIESFAGKVSHPSKEGKYERVDHITDLSGLRIIAYYQKDVSAICKLIEENFRMDPDNSIDKNETLAPDRFGYLSIHYIVSHSAERESLPENKTFKGLKAEVQVRTVLQHAWAVLDRKLRYNQEEDIPREVRRKLFRVSALLEIADENFSEVDRLVASLRAQYESDIKLGNLDQEINLDSLEVFMRESGAVKALIEEAKNYYQVAEIDRGSFSDPNMLRSISNLVIAAHVCDIKSIRQLNQAVVEFNKNAKDKWPKLLELSKGDIFSTAGLIRLCLVYVAEKEVSARVLSLVPFNGELQDALFKLLHPDLTREDKLARIADARALYQWVAPRSGAGNRARGRIIFEPKPSTSGKVSKHSKKEPSGRKRVRRLEKKKAKKAR